MNIVFTIVVFAFVISVLAVGRGRDRRDEPAGRHRDHYRDPETGERRFESPRLD